MVIFGIAAVACTSEAPSPADNQTASQPTPDIPATVEASILSTREAEAAIDATVEAKVAAALTAFAPTPAPMTIATPRPTNTPNPTATPRPTPTVAIVDDQGGSVASERALQRERVELSRTIHDTVAQSVYVVGLGIETARDLAKKTGDELAARLDETYTLSRTALWELRHPIDSGRIFEGMGLGEALSSHAYSFTAITSLPVEVAQAGDEPDLPSVVRGLLFEIVHNAMTNVLLHAKASRVEVRLDFQADQLCLFVSDDGIGIPQEGGRWGHGLRNMDANAKRMGGRLEVSPGVGGVGTRVTCVVPYQASPGGV